jgi:CheY-like chemotaxis protein
MRIHDQRRHTRVRKNFQVTLHKRVPGIPDGLLGGNTLDLSQGGAFIKTVDWHFVKPNELTELTIFLPPDFTGMDAPIGLRGSAIVRRVDQSREGIAVEFINELRQFRPITVSCYRKSKTLIVEDNANFRRVLKQTLCERFPCMNFAEAADGEEALRKIDTLLPNLIFMDINLPGENGFKLSRKIKATHPETPIMILTSYDLPEYRQAAYESGASAFLVKGSFTLEELFTLVESLISVIDVPS